MKEYRTFRDHHIQNLYQPEKGLFARVGATYSPRSRCLLRRRQVRRPVESGVKRLVGVILHERAQVGRCDAPLLAELEAAQIVVTQTSNFELQMPTSRVL